MDVKTKEMYSEVYSVLNLLGKNYIEKLPTSLYKMIEEEKSETYNPYYDSTMDLDKQDIKRETLAMIALLHLNYWCKTTEEKEELKNIFKENEENYQREIRELYNPDNLFKKSKKNEENEENIQNETVAIVEYKEPIIKRIVNKILKFLHLK